VANELRPAITWVEVLSLYPGHDEIYTDARTEGLLSAVGKSLAPGRQREELALALSSVTAMYGHEWWDQEKPSEAVAKAQAREVVNSCGSVLNSVGLYGTRPIADESLYPFLGAGGLYAAAYEDGGKSAVLAALASVANLKRWAEGYMAHLDKRTAISPPPTAGRAPNLALERLLDRLTDIFFEAWDTLPALSTSKKVGATSGAGVPDAGRRALKEWEAAIARGGLEARQYETGEPMPVGFFRFLCEIMAALNERGIPAPETPGAVAQAWRRWKADHGDAWKVIDRKRTANI
jgi:hypothetical protein